MGALQKFSSDELSFDERVLLMDSEVIKVNRRKEAENYFFLHLRL